MPVGNGFPVTGESTPEDDVKTRISFVLFVVKNRPAESVA